jgi:MOSC domain-containing protein YiiM
VEPRVSHLFLKPAPKAPMQPRPAIEAVTGRGLTGDAAFDRTSRRQVLLIDEETLAEFALAPGMIRENITISGLPLHGLARGSRLHLGKVVLEVTGDCTPCDFIESLRPGLREALRGRRGVLAHVAVGGELHVGDPVRLEAADSVGATPSAS